MRSSPVQIFFYRRRPIVLATASIFYIRSLATAFLNWPSNVSKAPPVTMGKSTTTFARGSFGRTEGNSTDVSASSSCKTDPHLPSMIVFDLDDCLWSPEMFTLRNKPSIPVEGDLGLANGERGIIGMKVPNGPTVRLFDGARKALCELATDPKYQGIVLALASSSEEPSYSAACLNIDILPGLSMKQMFSFVQIGRTGQLSSRKTTHLSLIQKESSVSFEEMLFFDDCNWGDHVSDVYNVFGVIGQRTPRGLTYSEFHEGLRKYRKASENRVASK